MNRKSGNTKKILLSGNTKKSLTIIMFVLIICTYIVSGISSDSQVLSIGMERSSGFTSYIIPLENGAYLELSSDVLGNAQLNCREQSGVFTEILLYDPFAEFCLFGMCDAYDVSFCDDELVHYYFDSANGNLEVLWEKPFNQLALDTEEGNKIATSTQAALNDVILDGDFTRYAGEIVNGAGVYRIVVDSAAPNAESGSQSAAIVQDGSSESLEDDLGGQEALFSTPVEGNDVSGSEVPVQEEVFNTGEDEIFSIAANGCGGATTCNCSNMVLSDYTLAGDLKCAGGSYALFFNDSGENLTLDCNGFVITGGATGGLSIYGENITVTNCVINTSASYGISMGRANITIKDSNITNYNLLGISALNAYDLTVINTTFVDAGVVGKTALQIASSNGANITQNTFREGEYGVSCNSQCMYMDINFNSFYNFSFSADSSALFFGSSADGSGNISFTNNNITLCTNGIAIDENGGTDDVGNLTVKDNTFINLSNTSILLRTGTSYFLRNNFINATNDTIIYASGNNFNSSSTGNYWASYDTAGEGCNDADTNGYCDSPYNVSAFECLGTATVCTSFGATNCSGQNGCSYGNPQNCFSYGTQGECEAALCAWSGSCDSCDFKYFDQGSCDGDTNCEWNATSGSCQFKYKLCSGTATACDTMFDSSCAGQTGCSWSQFYIYDWFPRTSWINWSSAEPADTPKSTEFAGGSSTDFASMTNEELESVERPTLEVDDTVKLNWSGNLNCQGVDFDSGVNMDHKFVSVDTGTIGSQFNVTANITMAGINCENYVLFWNPGTATDYASATVGRRVCTATTDPSCTIHSCANGNITFEVSHFTTFVAGEEMNITVFSETDDNVSSANGIPNMNRTHITYEMVYVYANVTNKTDGVALGENLINCTINFSDSIFSGVYAMNYSYEYKLWTFNHTEYPYPSLYNYTINCSGPTFKAVDANDSVNISQPLCGTKLNTSVNLVHDLLNSTGGTTCPGHGLSIYVADIQINCSGNSIIAKSGSTSYGLENEDMAVTGWGAHGCNIMNFAYGIYSDEGSNTVVEYNNLSNNPRGFEFGGSVIDSLIRFNNVSNFSVSGISISGTRYNFSNNYVYSTFAGIVTGTTLLGSNNLVANNTFITTGNTSVLFRQFNNATIINNTFNVTDVDMAVEFEKVYDSVFIDNIVYTTGTQSNRYGLNVTISDRNNFTQNTIFGADRYAIWLSGDSDNNLVWKNELNFTGVLTEGSGNNFCVDGFGNMYLNISLPEGVTDFRPDGDCGPNPQQKYYNINQSATESIAFGPSSTYISLRDALANTNDSALIAIPDGSTWFTEEAYAHFLDNITLLMNGSGLDCSNGNLSVALGILNSTGINITGLKIKQCGYGIVSNATRSLFIHYSNFTSSNTTNASIHLDYSFNVSIYKSNITGTGKAAHGIYLYNSSDVNISSCNFINGEKSGTHIGYRDGSPRLSIRNNYFGGSSAVLDGPSDTPAPSAITGLIVQNNVVTDGSAANVDAFKIVGTGGLVENNTINWWSSSATAINLRNANYTIVENNTFIAGAGSFFGLTFSKSNGCNFSRNNITTNGAFGIRISDSSYGNTFTNMLINATGSNDDIDVFLSVGSPVEYNFTNLTIISPAIDLGDKDATLNFWNLTLVDDYTWVTLRNVTVNSSVFDLNAPVADKPFNVSFNRTYINTTNEDNAVPQFNTSATIYFSGLPAGTVANPKVYVDQKDGNGLQECPVAICTETTTGSGIVAVNVTGFSEFQVGEEVLAPVINSINLTPSIPSNSTLSNFTCNFSATDPNGDAVFNTTKWYNDSIVVPALENHTVLDAANTTHFENWSCSVQSYDGTAWSAETHSSKANITDSIPVLASVEANSSSGNYHINENLTAYNGSSTDADLDTVYPVYDWRVNGTSVAVWDVHMECEFNNNSLVRDYSTYGINGTVEGSTACIPFGGADNLSAYKFDASDTYIDFPQREAYGVKTFDFWATTTNPADLQIALYLSDGDTVNDYLIIALFTNKILAVGDNANSDSRASSVALIANTWYHITVTKRAGEVLDVYVDGINRTAAAGAMLQAGNEKYVIGASFHGGAYNNGWKGLIDGVKLFNKSLDDEEILELNETGPSWSVLHSNFTTGLSNYTVAATANDGYNDGLTVLSESHQVINNANLPVYTNFSGGTTTNFDQLTDSQLQNVQHPTLEVNDQFKLNWSGTRDCRNVNFNSGVQFGSKYIAVNTTELGAQFNVPANITLGNVECSNVALFWSDKNASTYADSLPGRKVCNNFTDPYCKIMSCANGNVTFEVSHFTAFIAGEEMNITTYSEVDRNVSQANGIPHMNRTRITNEHVLYYANVTNKTSDAPLTDKLINCTINFSDPNVMEVYPMNYSYEYDLWQFNYSNLTTPAIYNYTVNCSGPIYKAVDANDTANISQPSCGTIINTSVTLAKNVTRVGATGDQCNLDGFVINAPDIVIDCNGYTLKGDGGAADYAIDNQAYDMDNLTVMNCNLINFSYQVYTQNSNIGRFEYNNMSYMRYGVYMQTSSNNTISFNNMTFWSFGGIYGLTAHETNITNNTLYDIDGGTVGAIELWTSHRNVIVNNSVYSGSKEALKLSTSSNNTILENYFNVTTVQYAINFNTVTDSIISRNIVHRNTSATDKEGLFLDSSDYNNISNNTFVGHTLYSLHLDSDSHYNNVWENRINDTGSYDLGSGNQFCVNGWGNLYLNMTLPNSGNAMRAATECGPSPTQHYYFVNDSASLTETVDFGATNVFRSLNDALANTNGSAIIDLANSTAIIDGTIWISQLHNVTINFNGTSVGAFNGATSYGVYISNSSDITISKLNISNCYQCVYVKDSNNITIEDSNFTATNPAGFNDAQLYLAQRNLDIYIDRNNFTNVGANAFAIYVADYFRVWIRDNVFAEGNANGYYVNYLASLFDSYNLYIHGNTFTGQSQAIRHDDSGFSAVHDLSIRNNVMVDHATPANPAVDVRSVGGTIANNTIDRTSAAADALYVRGSYIAIANNTIFGGTGANFGLRFVDGFACNVSWNNITTFGAYGIGLENQVTDNVFSNDIVNATGANADLRAASVGPAGTINVTDMTLISPKINLTDNDAFFNFWNLTLQENFTDIKLERVSVNSSVFDTISPVGDEPLVLLINRSYINTSNESNALIQFNSSAVITFRNITWLSSANALVNFYDGNGLQACPASICTEITGDGAGTFVMNVTQFSEYQLEGGARIDVYWANSTPPLANQSDIINLSANVTALTLIDKVFAQITYPNGSAVNLTLVNETSAATYSVFNGSFTDTTAVGWYTVLIYANDTSSNINFTVNTSFRIDDITIPNVFWANATPVAANQSDIINITVNLTDNYLVDTVLAEVIYPNGSSLNVTLVNETAVATYSVFNGSFGDTDGVGRYNVTIFVNDTSGNSNFSINYSFTISDALAPAVSFANATPVAVNQSDLVNITANVTDSWLIDQVLVEVVYPNGSSANFTMENVTADIFNYTFSDSGAIGRYNISIFANDSFGNINFTTNFSFNVSDVSIPSVTGASTDIAIGNQSDGINISIVVGDISVDDVIAEVLYPNGTRYNFTMINGSTNGLFNVTFTETSAPGRYNLTFFVNDTSGNRNDSVNFSFVINDIVAPNVKDMTPLNGTSYNVSTLVNITVNASDLYYDSIVIVYANVTLPNGTIRQLALIANGTPTLYNASFADTSLPGTYSINVISNDTSLNSNSSSGWYFVINDTVDPQMHIMSPGNGTTINGSLSVHEFNISDNGVGPFNCTLYVNDTAYGNNASVVLDTPTNLTAVLIDGDYRWTIVCIDEQGNENSTINFTIKIDANAPEPFNHTVGPANGTASSGTMFNMSFNLRDASTVGNATGYLQNPDEKTNLTFNFTKSGSSYNFTWNSTGYPGGVYLVDILTNDSLDHNKEWENQFVISISEPSTVVDTNASADIGPPAIFVFNSSNVTSTYVSLISTNDQNKTSVSIIRYTENPVVANIGGGYTPLQYSHIIVTNETNRNITSVTIRFNYSQQLIISNNLDEATLRILRYNQSTEAWASLVTVVDASANIAYTNQTGLSIFALAAQSVTESSPPSDTGFISRSSGAVGGAGAFAEEPGIREEVPPTAPSGVDESGADKLLPEQVIIEERTLTDNRLAEGESLVKQISDKAKELSERVKQMTTVSLLGWVVLLLLIIALLVLLMFFKRKRRKKTKADGGKKYKDSRQNRKKHTAKKGLKHSLKRKHFK